MARFVLRHFYQPQSCSEPRTAQFRETTTAFCIHVCPCLRPSRFLWDFWWQEPVLVSSSHLHSRTVPWHCLLGRFGDGQMCSCYASPQAGLQFQCLSAALSKAQLSTTATARPPRPSHTWTMLMLCSGTHIGLQRPQKY